MDQAHRPAARPLLRATAYGFGAAAATILLIGVPTVLIPNPWFSRMLPTRPQDYVFLVLTAILAGLLGATYAFPATCSLQEGKFSAGGLLSFLAVGCPVCNKVVILLLGASGAVTYFEPLQPVLGAAGMLLLGFALAIRLRAIAAGARLGRQGHP